MLVNQDYSFLLTGEDWLVRRRLCCLANRDNGLGHVFG
jgi:hypothetical protein